MADLRDLICRILRDHGGIMKASEIVSQALDHYVLLTAWERESVTARKKAQVIASDLSAGAGLRWVRVQRGLYAPLGWLAKKERGVKA